MNRRSHIRRAVVLYTAAVLIITAGAYLSFELGRYQAGYSLLDQGREREQHARLLAERDAEIEELRRQIAVLETSREIDRETYAQVEANLSRLQQRIQHQEEELGFYRGIVSPPDGTAGLRIQSLEIEPQDTERQFLMRLVLVQAIIHDRRVSGAARLQIAGSLDGSPVVLELAELAADGDEGGELAYAFRYFQDFEREIVLPVGFEPERIDVEIWPSEPRGEMITRSFPWSQAGG